MFSPLRRAALVGALVAGLVLALGAPGIALGAQVPKLPSTITPFVMAPAAVTNPTPIPVQGAGRVETAIAASQKFGTAQNVVLATGSDFPDALGGSGLAGAVKGPILLTRGTEVDASILAEINRLGATKVYILGGPNAVSAKAEATLKGKGLTVERLEGANRYVTAKRVADKTISLLGDAYTGGAFIATGDGYADALAAAPIMYKKGMPLVLVDTKGNYTLSTRMNKVNILGGTVAVPKSVETRLGAKAGKRLDGAGRYETAVEIAEYGVGLGMKWNNLGIATGESFPDALCAGPLLGSKNSVLLMTQSATLTPVTRAKLSAVKAGVQQYYLFGGATVITPTTRADIATGFSTTTTDSGPDPDPDPDPMSAHDLPDVFCTGAGCHGGATDIAMLHVNIPEGKVGCNYCHGIAGGPTSDCEGCHVGDNAAHVDTHPVVPSSGGSCTQSGCHEGGVVAIHADCTSCHNNTTDVVGATCETCHASADDQHADVPAHTVVNTGGGCFDALCHGTDVVKMHAIDFRLSGEEPPGCSACHAEGVTPSVTCLGACHPVAGFGEWHSSTAGHSALDAGIAVNSKGCVSCHGSDLFTVTPDAHAGCSCHGYGQGAGADSCESCHADPLDPRAADPYHVGVHNAWEITARGTLSRQCVTCHGRVLVPIPPIYASDRKDAHGGCVCHYYDTLFTDDYQPIGATTTDATECVSCHGGAFAPHGGAFTPGG